MEKIFEDKEYIFERFTCDCKEHLLEVTVEKFENAEPLIEMSNRSLDCNDNNFWERLKYSLSYLFGKNKKDRGCFWGFILQEKDVDDFVKLLEKAHVSKI